MAQPQDDIDNVTILCSGGLNTSENFLQLNQENLGQAVTLVNYETSLRGGYRRINGYRPINTASTAVTNVTNPAEGPLLAVVGFNNRTSGEFETYAIRKLVAGNTYAVYKNNVGVGWTTVTTGLTRSSVGVTRIRYETFVVGANSYIIFVDGVNPAMLFDGTTWYELESTGLGTQASPGGDQILDAPSLVTFFKGHIFLSGDPSFPTIVCHSAPTSGINGPFDFTVAAGGGQIIAGFEVRQIRPFRDENFIFGRNAIQKVLPDTAAGFVLQDVTGNIGCVAPDSVLEFSSNLIFLGPDGVRIVAGTDKIGDVDIGTVSQPIQRSLVDLINTFDPEELIGVVIRNKAQFRYFISSAAVDRVEASGVIAGVRVNEGQRSWEYGDLKGIQANTTWSGFNNSSQEIIYHGDYDGNAYQQESGNGFDDENIFAQYSTPQMYFDNPITRKSMKKLYTYIRAEGSVTVNVGVLYQDHGVRDSDIIQPTNYTQTLGSGTVQYGQDGVVYGTGFQYGTASQVVMEIQPQGSGYSIQFSYVTDGIFAPYTIQGFTIEFTGRGRA